MEHRLAEFSDIDRIMEIIAEAQAFMKESGVDQWQDGYPTREAFESDINKRCCHVFLVKSKIAGVISILFEPEECYGHVEDGAWLTDTLTYAVFHRSAVGKEYRGTGIANEMLSYADNITKENGFNSLRGDTHRDNKAMRGLLAKRGFTHCGTIYLKNIKSPKNERVCYEKLL